MLFGGNIRRAVLKIVQSLSLGTAGRQIFCFALQCVDSIDWPERVSALNFRPHSPFFLFFPSIFLLDPTFSYWPTIHFRCRVDQGCRRRSDRFVWSTLCVASSKTFFPPLLFPSLPLSLPIFAGWHIVLFEWLKLNWARVVDFFTINLLNTRSLQLSTSFPRFLMTPLFSCLRLFESMKTQTFSVHLKTRWQRRSVRPTVANVWSLLRPRGFLRDNPRWRSSNSTGAWPFASPFCCRARSSCTARPTTPTAQAPAPSPVRCLRRRRSPPPLPLLRTLRLPYQPTVTPIRPFPHSRRSRRCQSSKTSSPLPSGQTWSLFWRRRPVAPLSATAACSPPARRCSNSTLTKAAQEYKPPNSHSQWVSGRYWKVTLAFRN